MLSAAAVISRISVSTGLPKVVVFYKVLDVPCMDIMGETAALLWRHRGRGQVGWNLHCAFRLISSGSSNLVQSPSLIFQSSHP